MCIIFSNSIGIILYIVRFCDGINIRNGNMKFFENLCILQITILIRPTISIRIYIVRGHTPTGHVLTYVWNPCRRWNSEGVDPDSITVER